jgi:hypothetical protein
MVLLLLGSGPGQPPDTKAEEQEARAGAKKLAGEYVVELDEVRGKDKKLRLEPEPVFRWINQLERRFYGDVYVWTNDGRPEVIASLTTVFGPTRKTETEIHSLSTGRPVMSHNGKPIWAPEAAGLEMRPVADAPKPGTTAPARVQQMRALAAQFTVVADYGGAKEDKETLRLMGTPIYRYESATQNVSDGALFAYSKGTDPEAFLMIEARGKKDEGQWQFAFVRFNGNCSFRAVRNDKEVWRVERLSLKVIGAPDRLSAGRNAHSNSPCAR